MAYSTPTKQADRFLPVASSKGLLPLVGAVLFFSSGWPLTKLAIQLGATPLWFAEGRVVLSGLAATLILLARRSFALPTRADLPAIVVVGLLQLASFFVFTHLAVAWVSAGRTTVLANTSTIFVVPLSLVILREQISSRRWLATIAGVAGVIVLMGPWAIDWTSPYALMGNSLLLCAALSWALDIIAMR